MTVQTVTSEPRSRSAHKFNMGGVDAHRSKMILARFKTELGNLIGGGIRFEQGMVDHARQGDILRDDTDRGGQAFQRRH